MKVTSIKAHINRAGRYSVFIDGEYAFSLSDSALLASKLVRGQDVDEAQITSFKAQSANDALYNQTLRYAAMRLRSRWEIKNYLQRKNASPPLVDDILNKLSDIDLINDEKYARAYTRDRLLLRPTSRRTIIVELKKKHLTNDIIQAALVNDIDQQTERSALQTIIERKRKQPQYQDDRKLMQYLSRQGFSYGDIKSALSGNGSDY